MVVTREVSGCSVRVNPINNRRQIIRNGYIDGETHGFLPMPIDLKGCAEPYARSRLGELRGGAGSGFAMRRNGGFPSTACRKCARNGTYGLGPMKQKWKIPLALFVLLVALAFLLMSNKTEVRYTITDLGTLGGISSSAREISECGRVAGMWESRPGRGCAFIWDATRGMTDLGPERNPNCCHGFGRETSSVLLKSASRYSWDRTRKEVWDRAKDSAPTVVRNGRVINISGSGLVLGEFEDLEGGDEHSFLWSESEGMRVLFISGEESTRTTCNAVNDLGQVVGETHRGGASARPFFWDNGELTFLSHPAKGKTYLTDLNDLGQVVGYSETRAYLRIERIRQLPGPVRDCVEFCFAILSLLTGPFGAYQPHVWEDGVRFSLNDLIAADSGWTLVSATAINNRGQIVGSGIIGRETHGLLLTPVPQNGSHKE